MTDLRASPPDTPPGLHHVEKLWREVGLPEYFLGNGGTNHKLYALYDAIRGSVSAAQPPSEPIRKLQEWADDFEAAAHEVPKGIKSTILMTRAQEVRSYIAELNDRSPAAQPPSEPYAVEYRVEHDGHLYSHMHVGKPPEGAQDVRWLYLGPPSPAGNAWQLLIQQLAWYYRVNDCQDRHDDDALEIPILDLKAADRIARELGLPNGPAQFEVRRRG